MKIRRILSAFVAGAMLMTSVSLPAITASAATDAEKAYLVDEFTARPKISLVYMEPDASAQTGPKFKISEKPDRNTLQVGDIFYVGVKYENFDQYKIVGTDNHGLFSFSHALLFDSDVLVPEPDVVSPRVGSQIQKMTDFQTVGDTALSRPVTNRVNVPGSFYYKSGDTDPITWASYEGYTTDTAIFYRPASTTQGVENPFVFGSAIAYDNMSDEPLWKGGSDGEFIVAIYQFYINKIPSKNGNYLDLMRDKTALNIAFGVCGQDDSYSWGDGEANQLDGFTDIDIEAVDLFSIDSPLYNLSPTGTPANQYENKSPNYYGLTVTGNYEDGSTKDLTDKVTWKYATTNSITDATSTDLKDMPDKWGSTDVTSASNEKYLYATYGGKLVCLGKLTILPQTIATITIGTRTLATGAYTTSDKVLDPVTATTPTEDIQVSGTYNNGDTFGPVSYNQFTATGVSLAKVGADSKLAAVAGTDTYAAGVNTFYVVRTSDLGKTLAEITDAALKPSFNSTSVTLDVYTISAPAAGFKVKYPAQGDGYVVIPTDATITAIKASETLAGATPKPVTVSTLGSNVKYYYDNAGSAAYVPANEITANTVKYYDATRTGNESLKDKHLYAIAWDGTAATGNPVDLGTFGDRAVVSAKNDIIANGHTSGLYTVADIATTDDTTYGDTLADIVGNNAKITVDYDDGTKNADVAFADLASDSIKLRIVDKDGNVLQDNVSGTTPLTANMKGGKLQFYIATASDPDIIGEVTLENVNKKKVKVTATSPVAPERTYNGAADKSIEAADLTALQNTISIDFDSALVTADTGLKADLELDGLTYEYNDGNAGNDKTIIVNGTPAVKLKATPADNDAKTKFDANYELELDNTKFSKNADDKTIITGLNGVIEQLELVVTSIEKGVTKVKANDTGNALKPAGTATKNASNSDFTPKAGTYITGDEVVISFTADYSDNTVTDLTQKNPTVKISDLALATGAAAGAQNANYKIVASNTDNAATATGEVQQKAPVGIKIDGTVPTYTYGGNTIPNNVIGVLKFKVENDDGSFDPAQALTADLLTVNGQPFDATQPLPVGTTTVKVSYNGMETTFDLVVNPKPVKLSDITFGASKVYKQDSTIASTATVNNAEAGDSVKVNITSTTFTDEPEAQGQNKNVTLKIAGLDNTNYQLVDEEGKPITLPYDHKITNGVINPDEQTLDEDVKLTKDPATNNVVVQGPLGDRIEYSKDNGVTWTKDPVFTNLNLNEDVTILARIMETDDHNFKPSNTKTATTKTYQYYFVARKVGNDTPIYDAYTDATQLTSATDINNDQILGSTSKTVTRVKTLYTDKDGTSEISTYPFEFATNNTNGNVEVYFKQSSGGGSGGGGGTSSYTVRFSAATNGKIASGNSSVSVTSGKTIAADKVPTIEANDGYTFVGWSTEGQEGTVDPTTVEIKKSTLFTAVYEAAATPAPATPAPTDTPVIKKDFDKPYASGYDDNTFRPDNNITRAELAAMIARLSYGSDLPNSYSASFEDVDNDAWYAKYIGYLEDKNVLSGYEDGTFRPENPVTRGEISSVIARAQRFDIISYNGGFTDVTDYDWAKDFIATLAEQGIVTGYNDGSFGPYNPLTRAEAVTMINKVLAPSTAVVTFTPSDINGHWAYDQIILAANEREPIGSEPAEEPAPVEEVTEAENEAEAETEVTEEASENEETTDEAAETSEDAAETENNETPAE